MNDFVKSINDREVTHIIAPKSLKDKKLSFWLKFDFVIEITMSQKICSKISRI